MYCRNKRFHHPTANTFMGVGEYLQVISPITQLTDVPVFQSEPLAYKIWYFLSQKLYLNNAKADLYVISRSSSLQ